MSFTFTQAQSEDWGDNKPVAEKEWMTLRVQFQAKIYDQASKHANWLLINAPNLNEDLYRLSSNIYENKAKSTSDPTLKTVFEDSALAIYDKRLELFGDSADVYNRKAKVLYKYKKGVLPDSELYSYYAKTYELNKTKTSDNNLYYYFELATALKKADKISDDEYIGVYDIVKTIFDKKAELRPDRAEGYNQKSNYLDQQLGNTIQMDCQKVKEIYGPKLDENPSNLKTAKFIYSQMVTNKCYDEPLLLKSAYIVTEAEPSAARYRTLGNLEKANNQENAIQAYLKAIELETSAKTKSDIYLEIAQMYKSSSKSTARSYAQKAIATGENTSLAYTFIGDLYMFSTDCASDSQLKSRLIYIAAYDKYKAAGNTAKMSSAKERFPSAEEIFYAEKKVGDSMNTGCWINESVVLDKR